MRHFLIVLCSVALIGAAELGAHPATERYIPIGQSSAATVEGTVIRREADQTRIVIDVAGTETTVVVNERTRIWIDRHHLGQPSDTGSYADCTQGRHVEIRYVDAGGPGVADWIKVQGVQR